MTINELSKTLDKVQLWLIWVLRILMVIAAFCKAVDICVQHHWGYIPFVAIALGLSSVLLGFLWICFGAAKNIAYVYVKAYKDKVVPQIEQDAIAEYLRQNPTVTEHVNVEAEEKSSESEVPEAKAETLDEHLVRLHSIEEMKRLSQENALRDQLASFMAKCEYETRMTEQKYQKAQENKRECILNYARWTFMLHGYKDPAVLYQLNECVAFFIKFGTPLKTLSIDIPNNGQLKQYDICHFGWNIAHQYGIPSEETAEFLKYTFHTWFEKTEPDSIAKNIKSKSKFEKIQIDDQILEHLDSLRESLGLCEG